jgi:sugar-specific transcriptional regulator TrmB
MKNDFDPKITRALSEFGLSQNQTLLYLTSLKHGLLTVLELSKLTKINRQTIYDEAERMIEMGIYDKTRKKMRKYIPVSPESLPRIGQKKIEEMLNVIEKLSVVIPDLSTIAKPTKSSVTVKYYEGLEKIKDAYANELHEAKGTEVLSLAGSIDDIFKFFPEAYWEKWNRQFVKSGGRSRMLVHESPAAVTTSKKDTSYRRETRYIPDFPLKVNIDIFADTVLIVSFYDATAIWIDSRILSQSYRLLFASLWSQAKRFS